MYWLHGNPRAFTPTKSLWELSSRSGARDLQLKRERRYYVYIMASRSLNLYTGVTDDIFRYDLPQGLLVKKIGATKTAIASVDATQKNSIQNFPAKD